MTFESEIRISKQFIESMDDANYIDELIKQRLSNDLARKIVNHFYDDRIQNELENTIEVNLKLKIQHYD
jgi:hypothetical protein